MANKKDNYVDGFVLVVPKKNKAKYTKMAQEAGKFWKKLGALDYKECMVDDMHPKGGAEILTFDKMVKLRKGETVWFSFITYRDRKHRDQVNKKVMSDPSMNSEENKKMIMPFDMKRMAYGGFKVIVNL